MKIEVDISPELLRKMKNEAKKKGVSLDDEAAKACKTLLDDRKRKKQ